MKQIVTFIGDIHSYGKHLKIADNPTVQVGDLFFGIGFRWQKPKWPDNFYFIRGNHDSPQLVRQHPNYLGDYGYKEDLGLFFVSGAESVDWDGLRHFPCEELPGSDLIKALELYERIKPEYVVTHDCPWSIGNAFFGIGGYSRTRSYLDKMLEIHQPKIWVFGHHHKSVDQKFGATRFVCLGFCEHKEIELDVAPR